MLKTNVMNYITRLVLFFILNFSALGIGGLFTNKGVRSAWYDELHKAPRTPPGYVFGLAWTAIMVCFSFFMAGIKDAVKEIPDTTWYIIFAIQWVFNVAWNPLFFKWHLTVIGLADISLLLLVVAYIAFISLKAPVLYTLLIAPYFIWLIIATSLNAYIVVKN
jgi:tryptophan-rich sensory protein